MRVSTVGHSTRSADELVRLLRDARAEVLLDVRRFPMSRRHPQFNREALQERLEAAGIEYHHAPELGGRRSPRPDSPNTGWRNAGFRAYADYMATPEFGRALDRLLDLAAGRTASIMCAEAVPWRCHRRLIADALVARGVEVRHLLAAGRSELHELNPLATVRDDGTLVYPRPQGELFDDDG